MRIRLGLLPEELDDLPTIYKDYFEDVFPTQDEEFEKNYDEAMKAKGS
jgi:hypothetical protein